MQETMSMKKNPISSRVTPVPDVSYLTGGREYPRGSLASELLGHVILETRRA